MFLLYICEREILYEDHKYLKMLIIFHASIAPILLPNTGSEGLDSACCACKSFSVLCCLSYTTHDWQPTLVSSGRKQKVCLLPNERNMSLLGRNRIISRVVIRLSPWSGMRANWNVAPTMMQLMIASWDSSIALIKGIRCTVSMHSIPEVNMGRVLQHPLIPSRLGGWEKPLQDLLRLRY